MNGLLLVDKPSGCTSHDVVQRARKALRERKIGHCGTLDPSATGLLLLTLGKGTRLTRFLIRAPKIYQGTIQFGVVTDTYDAEGRVTREGSIAGLASCDLRAQMAAFEGAYDQLPPPYCAKKKDGRKFYELAREGLDVPTEPTRVEVFEFVPLTVEPENGRLEFRLSCSSGTYARSLAHDLGERLGCGAHLAGLRRTRIGHFRIEDAIDVERLEQSGGDREALAASFIPFDEIPLPFAEITADPGQERRLLNGQTVVLPDLDSHEGDWIKLVNSQHRFVAVGTVVEKIGDRGVGVIQPRIVFK